MRTQVLTVITILLLSTHALEPSFSTFSTSSVTSHDVVNSARKLEFGNSNALYSLALEFQWKRNQAERTALYRILPNTAVDAKILYERFEDREITFLAGDNKNKAPWIETLLTIGEAEELMKSVQITSILPVTQFGKLSSGLFQSSGNLKSTVSGKYVNSSEKHGNPSVPEVSSLYVRFGITAQSFSEDTWDLWILQLSNISVLETISNNSVWMSSPARNLSSQVSSMFQVRKKEWETLFEDMRIVHPNCSFSKLEFETVSAGIVISKLTEAFKYVPSEHIDTAVMILLLFLSDKAEVSFIQNIPKVRLLNNYATGIVQSGDISSYPFYDQELTGSDQIIAISDTGIDVYSCFFYDSTHGPVRTSSYLSPDNQPEQRKIIQYISFADSTDVVSGHGTHVSGSAAGKSSSSVSDYDGIAYNAKIAFFDVGDSSTESLRIPNDIGSILLLTGYEAGARIHSASWGAVENSYSIYDLQMDLFMYENPDMLVVVAAGNCGEYSEDCSDFYGSNSVGTPAVAKNVLSVGASMNYPFETSLLAYFSSRGPTVDGRIKPDIVAPGMPIRSAYSSGTTSTSCSTMQLAGTSMATPIIAGSAALVREYFVKGFYPFGVANANHSYSPSAALVKAVLLNGAEDLTGVLNSDETITTLGSAPDFYQGFGLVNLANSLPFGSQGQNTLLVFDHESLVDQEEFSFNLTIYDASKSLKITLTWTDPPATVGSIRNLVNDLDLTVTMSSSNETYYPNGGTSRDSSNNVERITIPTTSLKVGQQYIVTVKAHYLSPLYPSQKFALVAIGKFKSNLIGTLGKFNGALTEHSRTWTILMMVGVMTLLALYL